MDQAFYLSNAHWCKFLYHRIYRLMWWECGSTKGHRLKSRLDSMFYWCQLVCKELSEWVKLVSVLAIIPVPTLTRVQKRPDSALQLTWIVSLLIKLLMHKGTTCFTQHLTGISTQSTVGHTVNFRSATSIPSLKTAPGPIGRYTVWCHPRSYQPAASPRSCTQWRKLIQGRA